MSKLGDLYTDFYRVDLDAPGGYARVASVAVKQEDGTPVHRAFKLMRHELENKKVALQRFENELKLLVEVNRDINAPSAITRIYDSGFVEAELSIKLDELQHNSELLASLPNLEIISTGVDVQKFLDTKSTLMEKEPDRWLPYLVVDLAPYDDSLFLQIKKHSAGGFVDIYALPVYTIVEMAQQLLDVMDYIHRTLHRAYIDWKPEHIYWNESKRKLKLIDWNVSTQLKGDAKEKQTIREDIRMFCGAALYCSLALTDPEELKKPIGDIPKNLKDKTPSIPPRYWTSKPNFYQRSKVLDQRIKDIVQMGLDPNRGFNSPQDLKDALTQYILEFDTQNDQDVLINLPEAVQHFRRARSYIAAEDYSYAALSLENAIATAKAAGRSYRDAEKLLASVQDILVIGEFRQKVKLVLELGQWKDALSLYYKAIMAEPKNVTLKEEFENIQSLLRSETELKSKGIFRIFTNLFKLKKILKSTKDIINSDNLLYTYVKRQYNHIKLFQFGSLFLLFIVTFCASTLILNPKLSYLLPFSVTPTSTLTKTPSMTLTQKVVEPTEPPTLTLIPTDTLIPTSTPLSIKFYGILNVSFWYPLEEPDGVIKVGPVLVFKQELKIIDEKESHGALWYLCVWEVDGLVDQGWILAGKIKIVPQPTPTL